jgi:hypothetical protein
MQGYSAETDPFREPSPAISNIAKRVMATNQVLSLPSYLGENSTYNIQFRAPQLRCNTTRYNSSIALQYDGSGFSHGGSTAPLLTARVFESSWHLSDGNQRKRLFSVKRHRIMDYSFPLPFPRGNATYNASAEMEELHCQPYSMRYSLNITHLGGVQYTKHSIEDPKLLQFPENTAFGDKTAKEDMRNWPSLKFATDPQDFIRRLSVMFPLCNELALLDALFGLMTLQLDAKDIPMSRPNSPTIAPGAKNMNATWRGAPEIPCRLILAFPCSPAQLLTKVNLVTSALIGSAFDSTRFIITYDRDFSPWTDINITEETLNAVLTNVTISALSLGIWWDTVPVTTTRYRNTYEFSQPLDLILPYSISLAIATGFVFIGIWSLVRNGVAAADGGFLQVMMATRGHTEMEKLVLKEGTFATDEISREVKDLEIRYGELVIAGMAEDGAPRRLGFGTVDETASLRKRK